MAVTITLTLGDVEREFTLGSLLISEAREMKRLIGLSSTAALVEALQADDPDAIAFAWWLVNNRAGTPLGGKFIDLDFDIEALRWGVTGIEEQVAAAEEDADPDLPTSSGQEPDSLT